MKLITSKGIKIKYKKFFLHMELNIRYLNRNHKSNTHTSQLIFSQLVKWFLLFKKKKCLVTYEFKIIYNKINCHL